MLDGCTGVLGCKGETPETPDGRSHVSTRCGTGTPPAAPELFRSLPPYGYEEHTIFFSQF